ncbi:hypothetical protein ACFQS1_27540 [Paractinoplanes rhizophilus]|uniref:Uncharacterized protein n=1 Tax=Paractinoplanes rhizophilus TaxID=1416877 RepID=A0ABW2HX92_9ACTN
MDATDLIEECYRRGWTDGLPVVPPTPDRVEAMLGDAVDRRDEPIALLAPAGGVATREKIAANAVMAGCRPGYLPIVEAAVRAAAEPAFNLDRVLTTASSQSPVLLVNGPASGAVEASGDWEALGSKARANATIGRALLLVLRNVGSHRTGGLDHATLGHPGKYSYCFTEHLALSPWDSWHTERGLDPDRSWVSVFSAEAPLTIVDMGHDSGAAVLRTICESLAIPGTYNAYFRQDLWLVLSPQHAGLIARDGLSRADVALHVFEHARLDPDRLRGRGLYGYLDELLPPTWLDDGPVSIVDSPDRILVAVAGGDFGGYTAALFGSGSTTTAAVEAAARPVTTRSAS